MLDIKFIKENPGLVKERLNSRKKDDYSAAVDQLVSLDADRRQIISETEKMKAEQNIVSKSIPALKKEGKDTAEIFAKMKELTDHIKSRDEKLRDVETKINELLLGLPNIPNKDVPIGTTSEDNIEIHRFGEIPVFDFEPKPHWELGEKLDILDPATAAKVTGARFHFYKGQGAMLERAVMNFYLDHHTARGYTEILPPFIVNRASMTATGQLPKFEEDAFSLKDTDYFLIPTAEVPVTNIFRDCIIAKSDLPVKYCAYSPCFRAEAGSAGRDTRGLIRQHQFNKVELVRFSSPEDSYDQLESLTSDAENVLKELNLAFRRVLLCTGDLGNSAAMTYDIEVYTPSYGKYLEISSCSNFEDYQARRGGMRFRENAGDKPQLLHTLNGSGVAIGRTVAAILENFQNSDGSITIPQVLRKYMGGRDKIG